jgi:hypothetical protein
VQEQSNCRPGDTTQQAESTQQRQTAERLIRLEALLKLSRPVSSSAAMTQVLTAICKTTATLLSVRHVTVWLVDD